MNVKKILTKFLERNLLRKFYENFEKFLEKYVNILTVFAKYVLIPRWLPQKIKKRYSFLPVCFFPYSIDVLVFQKNRKTYLTTVVYSEILSYPSFILS